jgi:hypothetical protein
MMRHSSNKNIIETYVQQIATSPAEEVRQGLKRVITAIHDEQYPNESTKLFHALISCREIFLDGHPDSSDLSFDGELKDGGLASCDQYVTASEINPYDSKNYQIKAPIFYVGGGNDPATPPWEALYHYQHQELAKKYWMSAANASHAPLNKELAACSGNFWNSIVSDPNNAMKAFGPCTASSPGTNNSGGLLTSPNSTTP